MNEMKTYINGITEILFFISVILIIKYPVAIWASIVIAGTAIIVNIYMAREKKQRN